MLKSQEKEGKISLWFSDEASFSLNPVSMYAWQAKDSVATLPAERGKVSSIMGFVTANNESHYYDFQGNMCSHLWIKIMSDFVEKQSNDSIKTVVVIDRASTHTAEIIEAKRKEWELRNVYIHYLKPYCSELNIIEIVWRFMKHKWINVCDYISADSLKIAIENILNLFGKEYKINFQ